MNKFFYPRLAAQNIGKNRQTYVSYMLTCILTIAMFYIISTLSSAPEMTAFYGGSDLRMFLDLGRIIIGIFAVIFLFYTHSFIIKRRKKEFGLYNILGMEKKHIAIVLLYETVYCALISFAGGIALGMLLYKVAQLFLLRLVNNPALGGYYISVNTISYIFFYFGAIFLITYLFTLRQLKTASPVELLRGSDVGEKEPKVKILLVIIGTICLAGGYYISIAIKSPIEALVFFFLAVVMVIIGTYCLFTAISIAVLKLLRKNKKYYYNPRHFTFVSGMLYRMKQNAIGLANICILSTMVLVMISTTVILYTSIEDRIRHEFPRNITASFFGAEREDIGKYDAYMKKLIADQGMSPINLLQFYEVTLQTVKSGSTFSLETDTSIYTDDTAAVVNLITLDDYNKSTGQNEVLDTPQDVLLYTTHTSFNSSSLTINNQTFHAVKHLKELPIGNTSMGLIPNYYVIVQDYDVIQNIIRDAAPEVSSYITGYYNYFFDLDADKEAQKEAVTNMYTYIHSEESTYAPYVRSEYIDEENIRNLYGGLLFIGLFLGILFIIAAVLIIYYKQITEGYEDQARFEIMQNVGMSKQEVKRTIHSQVLSVFYMPYGMACIHTAFAFPIISRLMGLMGMTNIGLFLAGMIGTIILFGIFYTIVYLLTAKVYYKIIAVRT